DWARGVEIAAAVLFGIIVIVVEGWTGAAASSLCTLLLIAIAIGGSWWAFKAQQLLLDPVLPAAAAALVFGFGIPILLSWSDREGLVPIYALIGDSEHARSPGFAGLATLHQEFLDAYRSVDFATAAARLAKLRADAPANIAGLYEVYAQRLDELREFPPSAPW